jgi:hypothetical protein
VRVLGKNDRGGGYSRVWVRGKYDQVYRRVRVLGKYNRWRGLVRGRVRVQMARLLGKNDR